MLSRTKLVESKDADWLKHKWSKKILSNVNKSMAVLLSTVHLLRNQGVGVFITGVPHWTQYLKVHSYRPPAVLKRICEKGNIPYLDSFQALLDKMDTAKNISQYYWPNDGTHFNEAGNKIWAKAQLDFLLDPQNDLIPFLDYPKYEILESFKKSSLLWRDLRSRTTKKCIVEFFIDQLKGRNIKVKQSSSYCVEFLDMAAAKNSSLLQYPFDKVLHTVILLDNKRDAALKK